MLKELGIKNFALIDSLRVELGAGLNVLTGETGAGKSIIVDALGLVIGDRAQTGFVKSGATEAVVDALFEPGGSPAMDSLDIDASQGIIVKRTISSSGKGKSYINDSLVNIQTLATLGSLLVDIHGQNEHQSLLSRVRQQELLDSFGKLTAEVEGYAIEMRRFNKLMEEKRMALENMGERARKTDLLSFQVEEIEAAHLVPGEKETLLEEHELLAHLSEIKELSEGAYSALYTGEGSVADVLAKVTDPIARLAGFDKSIAEMASMAQQIRSYIQELTISLRQYKESIDVSPRRLEEVESRLDLIGKLERKYGDGIEAICAYKEEAQEDLRNLRGIQDRAGTLDQEIAELGPLLQERALHISRERTTAARSLEKEVNSHLKELAFNRARFTVDIGHNTNEDGSPKLGLRGMDSVEFLFSANPGEPLKPIQKVASGGELSRVMLAMKAAFTGVDDIPVLVFDEVDAGIGGQTAEKVADKLKAISKNHQVLCVTHLPQIASRADHHLRITKETGAEGVVIRVEALSSRERERELARMLSGSVTDISLEHARELLRKDQAGSTL